MEIREKDHKKANALIEIVEICMWWKDFKQVNIIHVNGNRQSHSTGKGYLCKSVIICTKKKNANATSGAYQFREGFEYLTCKFGDMKNNIKIMSY